MRSNPRVLQRTTWAILAALGLLMAGCVNSPPPVNGSGHESGANGSEANDSQENGALGSMDDALGPGGPTEVPHGPALPDGAFTVPAGNDALGGGAAGSGHAPDDGASGGANQHARAGAGSGSGSGAGAGAGTGAGRGSGTGPGQGGGSGGSGGAGGENETNETNETNEGDDNRTLEESFNETLDGVTGAGTDGDDDGDDGGLGGLDPDGSLEDNDTGLGTLAGSGGSPTGDDGTDGDGVVDVVEDVIGSTTSTATSGSIELTARLPLLA